jgi:hypothetical protein
VTIAYSPKDLALDVLAVALILAPEPLTTPIGISLLCRKRGSVQQHTPTHPIKEFPDYYYRIDTIRGREISWEVRTIYPGQLPHRTPNRAPLKIKPREEYILSNKIATRTGQASHTEKLPPGVKVHHTIVRPPRDNGTAGPVFIPGETIHHTVRQYPQAGPAINKKLTVSTVHHTIENSPGYVRHISGGVPTSQSLQIVHHTIKDAPAVRGGNPAGIVKPVKIKQHHEIDPHPKIEHPIIPPPSRRRGL